MSTREASHLASALLLVLSTKACFGSWREETGACAKPRTEYNPTTPYDHPWSAKLEPTSRIRSLRDCLYISLYALQDINSDLKIDTFTGRVQISPNTDMRCLVSIVP